MIFLPEAWPYSLDIPGAFRAIRCILHVQMATLESCIEPGMQMGRTNIRATRVSKWRLGAGTRHPPTLVMIDTSGLEISVCLHPALKRRTPITTPLSPHRTSRTPSYFPCGSESVALDSMASTQPSFFLFQFYIYWFKISRTT